MSRFAYPTVRAAARETRLSTIEHTQGAAQSSKLIGIARTAEALVGGLLTVALPLTVAQTGGTAAQVGTLFASFGVALLVGQSLWTRLPQRWGTPAFASATLGASGLAIVLLGANPTYLTIVAARCVQGALVGLATPPLVAWLAQLDLRSTGARLGSQNSLRMMAFTCGPLLGGLLFDRVPAAIFYSACGLIVATTGFALAIVRPSSEFTPVVQDPPSGEAATRVRSRLTLFLFLGAFAASAAATSLIVLLPVYRSTLELSSSGIGAALSAMLITRAILEWRAGALSDRWTSTKPITVGLLILAVGTVVAGASGTAEILIVGRVVQGVGMAGFATPALRWATRVAGDVRRVSIVGTGFSCGLIGGSIITGWLAVALSTGATLIWVLPLMVAAWGIDRFGRRDTTAGSTGWNRHG